MKPLPAIAAGMLVAFLVFAPMAAAAGTVTVLVSPTTIVGSETVSISGTVTPPPGAGYEASITVTNPSGGVCASANPSIDPTTGAFSFSFVSGGYNMGTDGIYSVSVAVTGYTTGTATFGFTTTPVAPPYNSTQALINIQGNLTLIEHEITNLNNDLHGNVTTIEATQTSQGLILTGLQSSMATLTSDVTAIGTAVSSLGTQLTNMQGTLTTINNNVQALNTPINNAAAQATDAANAVNSTQTYVLVVAVLVAITLVLELAILVRKLS